jgi:hypothetical protein
MTEIRPFSVQIPQSVLDELSDRLACTRWPDEVAGAGWDYGSNLDYMRELCDYWQNKFDWRAQEKAINQFANFRAEIDGTGIHFIHERGRAKIPCPLCSCTAGPALSCRCKKLSLF